MLCPAPRVRRDALSTGTAAVPALPRVAGKARIGWSARGLETLYQRAPARILFPEPSVPGRNEAVVIVTSGGLTGGDTLELVVELGPGASATLVTQAAERFYRVRPDDPEIRVETVVAAGAGASCEWLAQEAILFEGTRLKRRLALDVGPGARVLAVESLVFGRRARGETFASGRLHDLIRVAQGRQLVLHEALAIGEDDGAFADPFRLAGAAALATIVYAGPDAATLAPLARSLVEPASGGASAFDGVLLVRLRDDDPLQLRRAVTRMAGALRAASLGLPSELPRIWSS